MNTNGHELGIGPEGDSRGDGKAIQGLWGRNTVVAAITLRTLAPLRLRVNRFRSSSLRLGLVFNQVSAWAPARAGQ